MLVDNGTFDTLVSSPVRSIAAVVELYDGSTITQTFSYTDRLKSFEIQRVGEESKFFGFGICQRLNVKVIDKDRELDITTANSIRVKIGSGGQYISPYPFFYVSEVHRNENTNELSITAYDAIYRAAAHTISEIGLISYTIQELASNCAQLLGTSGEKLIGIGEDETCFDTFYETGANFEGTETIREVLDDIAEATQTVYYLNTDEELVFKRLDVGASVLTITKEDYFTLSSKTNRRLTAICSANELGDNVKASTDESGTTQYVRDNAFWTLRQDIGTLLDNALAAVGGMTINQFELDWRGNLLLEIGDKIELITKDNNSVFSYVLDDTITYDGALEEETRWSYSESEAETADNPTTLGEALNKTYARVDKANKQIELVASKIEINSENISQLQLNTEDITASVERVEQSTGAAIDSVNSSIETLTNKVEASMTAEEVKLEIKSELQNGVSKVETNTGFTFDDNGLTVSKSGSEMETTITEDGMTVSRSGTDVLTANSAGVDAVNLRATTYLIIGSNSRLEDYGSDRTACFWIGS